MCIREKWWIHIEKRKIRSIPLGRECRNGKGIPEKKTTNWEQQRH
jgi:hypothetical protein